MSRSGARQAYLQSELREETYVSLSQELWSEGWDQRFGSQTKVVVRLRKSLYGHPSWTALARILVKDFDFIRWKRVPNVSKQLVP